MNDKEDKVMDKIKLNENDRSIQSEIGFKQKLWQVINA